MAIVHAGRRRAFVPLCPRSQACALKAQREVASVWAMRDFVERRAAIQKFVGILCRGKVQYPRCRGARALRAVNPP